MGSFRLRPEVAYYCVDFHSTHRAGVAAGLQHAGALQAARDVPGFAVHDGRVAAGAEADDALRIHGRSVRDLLPADAHDGARDRFDVVAAAPAHARRLILRTSRFVRRLRIRAALEILLPLGRMRFSPDQLNDGQVIGRLAVQTLTNPPRAVFEFEPRNAVLRGVVAELLPRDCHRLAALDDLDDGRAQLHGLTHDGALLKHHAVLEVGDHGHELDDGAALSREGVEVF